MRPILALAALCVALAAANAPARASTQVVVNPIKHIVVIFMENHSFDDVLGKLCVVDHRPNCAGTTVGYVGTKRIPLKPEPDLIPAVAHDPGSQKAAMANGSMAGFGGISGCRKPEYACYVQYDPNTTNSPIKNVAALARAYAIADHMFEDYPGASWTAHMLISAATMERFTGDSPRVTPGHQESSGRGCDSFHQALWRSSSGEIYVPSCIPWPDGTGAYTSTPAWWTPTIMNRLDDAGLSWRIYTKAKNNKVQHGGWSICPTFADCVYSNQVNKMVPNTTFTTAAANGTLPAFSYLIPDGPQSQHNGHSMTVGDNWLGSMVSAVMKGPNWNSTAIFITWDDCGCFYDHVAPPQPMGIREPMIIVSPFAKAGFTDNHVSNFTSILAYTEHTYGLPPLNTRDANAYDFAGSFDYTQPPLPGVPMTTQRVPEWELRYIEAHPVIDPDDPVSD